jgi:MYXO-CTERM domain-containing protein
MTDDRIRDASADVRPQDLASSLPSSLSAAAMNLYLQLGAEYNDDPRIGFIEIGNYGKWGEGHSPGPNPATDATKQELVDMVLDAFAHQRHVVMSDDDTMLFYALNKSPAIGWRRDSLGWEHFYQTPENKWADDPVKWTLFTERWKTAPVVAEFAPWDDSNPTKARDGFFDRAMVGVERFHVTMMGNGNVPIDSSELTTEEVERLSAMHGSSGLRPRLKELQISAAETGTETLTASWENLGSAPAYEPYEVRFTLREPETLEALWTSTSSLEMEELFPTDGTPTVVVDTIVWPAALASDSLELTVQVMDPTGYREPLYLLNEGREPDGSYLLGELTLKEGDVGVDAGDAGQVDGSAGAAGAAGHPNDAGADTGTNGEAGNGNLSTTDEEEDGCGCRTAPVRGDAGTRFLLPLAVALLLLRRRLLPNLH